MASEDKLHDLVEELDYTYDRIRYYGDAPPTLEQLDRWRKEAREVWNHLPADGDDDKDMEIEELNEEIHDLRRQRSLEQIAHNETKAELAKVKAELEHEKALYVKLDMTKTGVTQ